MSDRLAELHRQRLLVQEHLAWLDREIAEASEWSESVPSAQPFPRQSREPLASASPVAFKPALKSVSASELPRATVTPAAEAILEEYRVAPATVRSDVKKGCLLYVLAAFALLALGVIVLSYALRKN